MHPLHFASSIRSETKQKAVEDACAAQSAVMRECEDACRDPPPYGLLELIGKGSFGRVYKASGARPGQLVAVKIISIEEGDAVEPGAADTLGDIIKEVNALKLLGDSGAKNVNAVVDTLLVGQSVWVVTEYCAGGSVASLMRPTSGLAERWIIPILREVAEALYWVHRQGIIHRDIKCANVLVTEAGCVQLCDFGVAGIIETKFDKRSTVTGTLHWMAPELFDATVSYGIEVDIWAFGSMAYEIANGLPPNATARINIQQFGSYLKQHAPRLHGDKFSAQLKHLIAFCLVEDPSQRPSVEQVQRHNYIFDTEDEYPTASLSNLIADYRVWESQGGSRQSLFSAGGARGPDKDPTPSRQSRWDFGDFDELDQLTIQGPGEVHALHCPDAPSLGITSKAPQRRRQPMNMKPLKGPLEKVFDPNTISNYGDNSRAWYGRIPMPPASDPPPRKEPELAAVRESLIDLDLALDEGTLSCTIDMETIKPATRPPSTDFIGHVDSRPKTQDWSFSFDRPKTQEWTFPSDCPKTGDEEETFFSSDRPKTQEWTFPVMASAFAGFDISSDGVDAPGYYFHPTQETCRYASTNIPAFQPSRDSALSLIDLDASFVSKMDEVEPSIPGSHARSPCSLQGSISFDLELDTHSPAAAASVREPSLYAEDDIESVPSLTRQLSDLQSTPSTPDERPDISWDTSGLGILANESPLPSHPPVPKAPSADVLQGIGPQDDLKNELQSMIWSLREHLRYANNWLGAFDVHQEAQT